MTLKRLESIHVTFPGVILFLIVGFWFFNNRVIAAHNEALSAAYALGRIYNRLFRNGSVY
jgi:hypothetical protein